MPESRFFINKQSMITNVSRSRSEKDLAALEQQSTPDLGYEMLTSYVRFYHNNIYYRNYDVVNAENIPQECPLMIVCDHQNNIFDVLGLLFSARARDGRKIRVIARGAMFDNPGAAKFFRWLGMLPAFRLARDGEEALKENDSMFWEAEEELLRNGTVIIFPEANEVPRRSLRDFSQGYLHILFEAAEMSGFEKEVFVMPACNHYSEYDSLQGDMIIKYGTPISLAPYYELYKSKPRTAKREVNALVREQMSELMLDIREEQKYDGADFLRETYGVKYAAENGYNPASLHEKLLADKRLCGELDSIKSAAPDVVDNIYDEALELKQKRDAAGLGNKDVLAKPSFWRQAGIGALLLVGLPLFLLGLIPAVLVILMPKLLGPKIKDPTLCRAAIMIADMLFVIPLTFLVILIVVWAVRGSFLLGLVTAAISPFLGIVAWYYQRWAREWIDDMRISRMRRRGELDGIIADSETLYGKLDNLLRKS